MPAIEPNWPAMPANEPTLPNALLPAPARLNGLPPVPLPLPFSAKLIFNSVEWSSAVLPYK
jgi:hypothetical protein